MDKTFSHMPGQFGWAIPFLVAKHHPCFRAFRLTKPFRYGFVR